MSATVFRVLADLMQAIHHKWSKKLNFDIQTEPGPEGQGSYLPAWDLLIHNIEASIPVKDTWTLPISRAEAEAVCAVAAT